MIRRWGALFFCAVFLFGTPVRAETLRIAAASSLRFALDDALEHYAQEHKNASGVTPQVVYGSSGNLFRQIMQGAPFDLFMSADDELITRLVEAGKASDAGHEFGEGRLVLFSSNKMAASDIDSVKALRQAIDLGGRFKLAIANPTHAPYGRAAQQSLESLGLWQEVQPYLVYGDKVSQAAGFVASGATSMGLISLSLAVSPVFAQAGTYSELPADSYKPVVQRMAKIGEPGKALSHLYNWLQDSDAVVEIFTRYGLR